MNTAVLPEEAADETTVTWTSSDEKIATVDENGKVTAIAAGEATITAAAGEKNATYKLTVQAKKIVQNTSKSSNKGNTSSSTGSSAPASNPTPAQPAPNPQPEQPSNPEPSQPSGGDSGSTENKPNGSGGWEWGGPVISTPTDNGCSPEEHAVGWY